MKNNSSSQRNGYPRPLNVTITLDGRTLGRSHHFFRVAYTDVEVRSNEFEALTDIVYEILVSEYGASTLPSILGKRNKHTTICRLRESITNAVGDETGKRLILHKGRTTYAINVSRWKIVIADSFEDLSKTGHLPGEKVQKILDAYRALHK